MVLDSFGVGEAPDAKDFGDAGSNTLKSVSESKEYKINNLKKLGLHNIDSVNVLDECDTIIGTYGKMQELSKGKDTTTGHWEMMGIISETPMPTFPNGFPDDFMKKFEEAIGTKTLCNKPYSGTIIPNKYFDKTEKRLSSIMLEINKRIYLNNENNFYKLKQCINDYYEKIQKDI